VARSLVVEGEAGTAVADPAHALLEALEAERRRDRPRRLGKRAIGGPQGALAEGVLEIGEHQLLVLLLVVEAELHHPQQTGRVVGPALQPREQLPVDGRAEAHHLVEGRAREETAPGTGVLGTHRVVIGVEQEAVVGVEGAAPGPGPLEHEGLEEPGGVGQVPLHRARVGHGLERAVLRGERGAERLARGANRPVARSEGGGGGGLGDRRGGRSSTHGISSLRRAGRAAGDGRFTANLQQTGDRDRRLAPALTGGWP
jgi:hypothetical protein